MKNFLVRSAAVLGLFSFWSGVPESQAKGVDMGRVSSVVGRLLEEGHYTRQKLDATMSQRILETYLETLDYNKVFFTQEDVDQLKKRYGDVLGADILRGNLGPANAIYSLFKQRVDDRLTNIASLLKTDFTFRSDRTVTLDRKNSPWPIDSSEADVLWRDRIEGELLQEKLNKFATKSPAEVMGRRYDQMLKDVNGRDSEDIARIFLDSAAQSYDPHSAYLGRSDLEQFQIEMRLSLSGIGAELGIENGNPTIETLFPGGPAENSGKVHVGDTIAAVAQGKGAFVDSLDMKLDKVVEMILGKKGSTVRLQIIPANSKDPSNRKVVELVRENVKLTQKEARGEIIEKKLASGSVLKLGVIMLPSFYEDMSDSPTGASSSQDVAALIQRMQKEGIQGLIVDLRRNPGGYLDEAVKISGLFINDGPVVQVKDVNGNISVLKTRNRRALYSGPLLVLDNKLSASASEIFSAAIQDYGRGAIVGDSSTFGKGTVQTTIELARFLPDLARSSTAAGALNLTIQKFYRVAGGSTQLKGVRADVTIPSLTDNREFGEISEENPLSYDQIEPTPVDLAGNRKPLFLDELRKRSTKRLAVDPQFADLSADIHQLEERLQKNRVSLNEKTRRSEMAEEDQRKAKEDTDRKNVVEADHDRYYGLTVADVNRPGLKPLAQTPAATPALAKNSDVLADNAGEQSDPGTGTAGDPAAREALDILSDLITLTQSQMLAHARGTTES